MNNGIDKDAANLADGNAVVQTAHDLTERDQLNEIASTGFSIKVTKKPIPSTPRGVLAE